MSASDYLNMEQHGRTGRSDLPRLSNALANHLNDSMESHMDDYGPEEGAEEFAMSHSLPSLTQQSFGEPFSEVDASNALNEYRKYRDSGDMDSEGKELYGEDIRDAYRNRG
jgi:hypothetical protein